ncbi:unnamed protein product [Acanthosepion pharaonis]|uniref:Uncharacterized protein n=1 Tax=Acanthosepion pharaonis TaxID=158019 RepID=A0A812CA24_ACAPH|nr:unnamed protein product [Sepia pharaonis]
MHKNGSRRTCDRFSENGLTREAANSLCSWFKSTSFSLSDEVLLLLALELGSCHSLLPDVVSPPSSVGNNEVSRGCTSPTCRAIICFNFSFHSLLILLFFFLFLSKAIYLSPSLIFFFFFFISIRAYFSSFCILSFLIFLFHTFCLFFSTTISFLSIFCFKLLFPSFLTFYFILFIFIHAKIPSTHLPAFFVSTILSSS